MAKEMPAAGAYEYALNDRAVSGFRTACSLTAGVVGDTCRMNDERAWMREERLKALDIFYDKPMPQGGGDLSELDFDEIICYVKPSERQGRSWDEVPEEIKQTFDRLGIPEAEQKYLARVSAQYESEVVYQSLEKDLEELGIIFADTDTALKEHEEIFKEYFGKVIPASDNKFSALNTAVWSGGSFIYVPKGVEATAPLQAYF